MPNFPKKGMKGEVCIMRYTNVNIQIIGPYKIELLSKIDEQLNEHYRDFSYCPSVDLISTIGPKPSGFLPRNQTRRNGIIKIKVSAPIEDFVFLSTKIENQKISFEWRLTDEAKEFQKYLKGVEYRLSFGNEIHCEFIPTITSFSCSERIKKYESEEAKCEYIPPQTLE